MHTQVQRLRPLFLGRYRLGLTNALTAGARAELMRRRASFGSELTLAGSSRSCSELRKAKGSGRGTGRVAISLAGG